MPRSAYDKSVFVNCPFDDRYKRFFDAIVFAVFDCGFLPRSALEPAGQRQSLRLQRIIEIIGECRYGIHDLSRASIDRKTRLARFNMPLELGIFLGARWLGTKKQGMKCFVMLDRESKRYEKFISDLKGIDPKSHDNHPENAITIVRDWLNDMADVNFLIPSGSVIKDHYASFRKDLPDVAKDLRLKVSELTYRDYCFLIQEWLKQNPV